MTALTTSALAQLKITQEDMEQLRKLQIAEMAVKGLYVEEVDEKKLVADAIKGMLEKLDPHSNYSTPQEMKQLTEPLQGNFEGIGVQYNMVEDTLVVAATIHNGPSEKVGIIAGDRIIAVNDTTIAGVKIDRMDIMKKLRGKKGTKVDVTVVRRSEPEPLHFTIKRDKIPLYSVDASYLVKPGVAYIRLGNFAATTHSELMHAIDSLRHGKEKLTIILDLQDNGGGYLNAAEDVGNEFLNKDEMIVYSEGRSYGRHEKKADGKGKLRKDRVIILVNEYTASAAEIVSGAIQDWDRGTIVGRRTFGKGLVQRPIDLPDGSMIRLTVAHYFTPTGRCIQKPYKPGEKKEYAEDIEQRFKHGELTCRDSIHFADSLRFSTLHKGRTVYGGGGIMPDEFVPLDTLLYTKYHRSLVAKSIVTNQVLRYYDANRNALTERYKDRNDFCDNFVVPQELIDAIVKEGKEKKTEPKDEDEEKRTMDYMTVQIKALIARSIFDESAYFYIINPTNAIYRRALELIEN